MGGVAAAAICAAVVWDGSLSHPERTVFNWINGLPDWLEPPLWLIQLAGSLLFVLGIAAIALLLRRWFLAIGLVWAVLAKLGLEWFVVKLLVERRRPSFTVAEAIVREESSSPLGFPSGHAMLAFAVAMIVAPHLGSTKTWLLFVVAAGVGVARIYLAAHNPLDVVAGAGMGIALGGAWNLLRGVPEPVPAGESSVDTD